MKRHYAERVSRRPWEPSPDSLALAPYATAPTSVTREADCGGHSQRRTSPRILRADTLPPRSPQEVGESRRVHKEPSDGGPGTCSCRPKARRVIPRSSLCASCCQHKKASRPRGVLRGGSGNPAFAASPDSPIWGYRRVGHQRKVAKSQGRLGRTATCRSRDGWRESPPWGFRVSSRVLPLKG